MNFQKPDLAHKQLLDEYASRFGEGSCQNSFTTWYTLQGKYRDEFAIEDDTLFIRRSGLCTPEYNIYLMPLGGQDVRQSIERLADDCRTEGKRMVLSRITQKAMESVVAACGERFRCVEARDYAEYFYRTDFLMDMKGPGLGKKRNNLGRFFKNCGGEPEVIPIRTDNLDEVRSYCWRWFRENVESHDAVALTREQECIALQLDHFEELGLRGFLLRIGGVFRGFCYGVPLSDQVFDGLIMKADRDVTQINVFMYSQIAKTCGCTWLNAEEDVGIPGLRESKLSYRPEYLLNKFILSEVAG